MEITEQEIDRCSELVTGGIVVTLPGDSVFKVLKFGNHPDTGRPEVHIVAEVTDKETKVKGKREVIVDLEDVKKLSLIH